MVENTVRTRAAGERIDSLLDSLPEQVSNNTALLMRVGLTVLGRVRRAFIVKARGDTDEAGDRWAPLSPKTIAYSRRGRSKAERGRAQRPSQALTKRQADRWWEIYRKWLAIGRRRGEAASKGAAAKIAWATLKREGATTLLDKYGKRQVEILRDTGLLLNSLSPGYTGAEQVLRTEGSAVVVGTNRKGAAAHHSGVPGKLPQRRLWPPTNRWPSSWWEDILDQAKQGVLNIAMQLVRGAT